MTTSERISNMLVAVPIAHLLGSALFLWSYCTGFGAHLSAHATATDVLGVSISDMVAAYLGSLLFPAATLAFRLTSKTPYATTFADSLPTEEQRQTAHKANRRFRLAMDILALLNLLAFSGLAFHRYYTAGEIPWFEIWMAVQIPAFMVWMRICERRDIGNVTFEAGGLLMGFVMCLFFIGATRGQSDRLIKYDQVIAAHTRCGKAAILRQLSGKYLVVLPDDSRALVSEECKTVFTVPPLLTALPK